MPNSDSDLTPSYLLALAARVAAVENALAIKSTKHKGEVTKVRRNITMRITVKKITTINNENVRLHTGLQD